LAEFGFTLTLSIEISPVGGTALPNRPGAPVSAPCTWAEIESGTVHPQSFTLRTMAERIAQVGDLWQDLTTARPRRPR
jgi:DNA primase